MNPDPTPDLTTVSFKDTFYLQFNGLHSANVLDYFSYSQYYDRGCDNEVVKMQSRLNNPVMDQQAMQDQLLNMGGYQYDLMLDKGPSLFVIRKIKRDSPSTARSIAFYYVIEGTIYQAPDLWTLLTNRLYTGLYFIHQAFEETVKESNWHPMRGYAWASEDEFYAQQEKEKREEVMPTLDFTNRVGGLINLTAHVVEEFPSPLDPPTVIDATVNI